jgi:hypothetical protein
MPFRGILVFETAGAEVSLAGVSKREYEGVFK